MCVLHKNVSCYAFYALVIQYMRLNQYFKPSHMLFHISRPASGVCHYLGYKCPPKLQLLCALRIASPREHWFEDGGRWWGFWWSATSPAATFSYRVHAAECVPLTQLVQSERATSLQLLQHTVPQQPQSQHSQLHKQWNTGLPHQHRSALLFIFV